MSSRPGAIGATPFRGIRRTMALDRDALETEPRSPLESKAVFLTSSAVSLPRWEAKCRPLVTSGRIRSSLPSEIRSRVRSMRMPELSAHWTPRPGSARSTPLAWKRCAGMRETSSLRNVGPTTSRQTANRSRSRQVVARIADEVRPALFSRHNNPSPLAAEKSTRASMLQTARIPAALIASSIAVPVESTGGCRRYSLAENPAHPSARKQA